LAQPSFAPPPKPIQLVALVDVQVIMTGLPGLSVVGEAVTVAETTGQTPPPESGTRVGVTPALTFKVAAFEPPEVGVNTTLIVQLDPTATDVPQLLVCENCAAPVPESAMLVTGSATVPVFLTVATMGALATFVTSLPNAKDVGDTV
jgi:hypothetical protein